MIQAHALEERRDALFQIGHIVHAAIEAQVLLGRKIAVEEGLVGGQADAPAHLVALPGKIAAGYAHAAPGGPGQSGQDAD